MYRNLKTKIFLITILIVTLLAPVCFADNEIVEQTDTAQNITNSVESEDISITDENAIVEDSIDYSDESVNDTASITQPDIYEGDLYIADNDIVMDKLVNGNVYIIGNHVKIDKAQIAGNLFILAQNVEFDEAYIEASAFICAKEVNFKAVASDLYICTENLTIPNNYGVYRDLKSVSKNLILKGIIGRDTYCCSESIEIDNSSTKFYGNFNYTTKNELDIPESLFVEQNGKKGSANYSKLDTNNSFDITDYILPAIWAIIFSLLLYGLFTHFAKDFTEKSTKLMNNKLLQSFGIGLLSLILVPIIGGILCLSIVGMPLGILLLALYFILTSISMFVFELSLLNILSNKFNINNIWLKLLILALLSIVIYIISVIPYVSILIIIPISIGFGMFVINTLFRNFNYEKVPKSEEPKKLKESKVENNEADSETSNNEENK